MSLPEGYETSFEWGGDSPAYPPDEPDTRTNSPEAASLSGKDRPDTQPDDNRTNADPPVLAYEPDILARFALDVRRAGLAGEGRLARLLFLAVTSRLLPWEKATNRPVSVLIRGTSSTGKSHAAGTVQRFFPPDAIVDLGSMSRRFLYYDDEPYSHRVLSVPEAGQVIGDEELLALLRTLLSEGRLIHGTVLADGKKPEAKRITKEGPTALLMATTRAYVDEELETRMLSVRSDDSPDQTRRVFELYADLEEEAGEVVDFERWHDLQRWLAAGDNRVFIPYTRVLAELMPTGAARLRRDFVSLLCLVRAHALLHRATREYRDGRILASPDDYKAVRGLVGAIIAEGVEAAVSPVVRETVEAVADLLDDVHTYVTPKELQGRMDVGRSATYDRIKIALAGGYLANETKKDERGYRLVLGSPLPGDAESYLPTVEDVVRESSGRATGRGNPYSETDSCALSGRPGRPAGTQENAESDDIDFGSDDDEDIEVDGDDDGDDIDFGPPRRIPVIGDDDYVDLLEAAHTNGHLTDKEAARRYRLHKAIARWGME